MRNARSAERLHLLEGTVRNNVSATLSKLQVTIALRQRCWQCSTASVMRPSRQSA
jgi:DNA-binding NarL/FixJ family response regulator